ncbi:hypothetical protein [Sphingosinicella sp. BN140058]|uniref:hypothetical protein n=1 Tax=Sphingosinicella sp. BN140058 TaxID=1892855 RepID=UPI0010124431|nr:hypothetical protein [Sphingosinicella sp. BN140058]QAY80355.1 hypothetical protein ETR14_27320 [Sphingosinicella sp. BN140058]
MALFQFSMRAFACVVERTSDAQGSFARISEFLQNYEVSEHELAGFNPASGTSIRSIFARFVADESNIARSTREKTTTYAAVDFDIELEAVDEGEAYRGGTDALDLYDFHPGFLEGYNSTHGTFFDGFTIDGRGAWSATSLGDPLPEPAIAPLETL